MSGNIATVKSLKLNMRNMFITIFTLLYNFDLQTHDDKAYICAFFTRIRPLSFIPKCMSLSNCTLFDNCMHACKTAAAIWSPHATSAAEFCRNLKFIIDVVTF